VDLTRGTYKCVPFATHLIEELGDPSEDAAVATVVFLLDGKLVLLRPAPRSEAPGTDLKYDMRVLADKVEFFILLSNSPDDTENSTLNGSVWAWDGKSLKVHLCARAPLIVDLDITVEPRLAARCPYIDQFGLLSIDHYPHLRNHYRSRIRQIKSSVLGIFIISIEDIGRCPNCNNGLTE
jgi:hypothetical protein